MLPSIKYIVLPDHLYHLTHHPHKACGRRGPTPCCCWRRADLASSRHRAPLGPHRPPWTKPRRYTICLGGKSYFRSRRRRSSSERWSSTPARACVVLLQSSHRRPESPLRPGPRRGGSTWLPHRHHSLADPEHVDVVRGVALRSLGASAADRLCSGPVSGMSRVPRRSPFEINRTTRLGRGRCRQSTREQTAQLLATTGCPAAVNRRQQVGRARRGWQPRSVRGHQVRRLGRRNDAAYL